MTDKQKRFCEEYLKDCNGTQAAIRCGYSPRSARQQADRLMSNDDIRAYIDEQLKSMKSETIADVQEVLEFLTKGIRQELEEEVVLIEGAGDGISEAVVKTKKISLKDSTKCAELLGKRYSLFTDKTQIEGVVPIVISGGDDLED